MSLECTIDYIADKLEGNRFICEMEIIVSSRDKTQLYTLNTSQIDSIIQNYISPSLSSVFTCTDQKNNLFALLLVSSLSQEYLQTTIASFADYILPIQAKNIKQSVLENIKRQPASYIETFYISPLQRQSISHEGLEKRENYEIMKQRVEQCGTQLQKTLNRMGENAKKLLFPHSSNMTGQSL